MDGRSVDSYGPAAGVTVDDATSDAAADDADADGPAVDGAVSVDGASVDAMSDEPGGVHEASRSTPRFADRPALWLWFVLLAIVRFPTLFHDAAFYAEEGNVYFGYAANHGVIDALFQVHVGYLSLFANAAGVVSSLVPLEYAVVATRLAGLAGPAVVAWVVIDCDVRRAARAAALAVLVFTYTMAAEWTTTIHTQFWLAIAVIVMWAVPPRSRLTEIAQCGVAAAAGLSGVLAGLAAPMYAVRFVRERRRRDGVVAAILGCCLVVQFVLSESREVTWHAGEFVVVAFLKFAIHPFVGDRSDRFGPGWYESWPERPVAALFLVLLVGWVGWVWIATRGRWRVVGVAAFSIGLIGLYFALPPYEGLARPQLGGRYSVVGVVGVLIAMVMSWDGLARVARAGVVVVVALAIVRGVDSGIDNAEQMADRQPLWQRSIDRYETDPGAPLAMDSDCLISVNDDAQRTGFDVELESADSAPTITFDITPGQYDREMPIEIFVFANASRETLTPAGWVPIDGFLYGDDEHRCHQSTTPVEPYATTTGPFRLELSAAELDALNERSPNIAVGYGRSFADALAKDTTVNFAVCRLRDRPCDR